jgi:Zn-finger nucleic acid-binding protein
MESVLIGDCHLKECPRCEGLWVDAPTLNQICTDREKQSAILGVAITLEDKPGQLEPVRYLPCPICKEFMNRVNFANCSHVIVDVCKPHGTWFDKDELRRIVEFIRGGGFDKARAIQIQQWQDERHRLESARSAPPPPDISSGVDFHLSDRHLGVSIAAAVLSSIFD